MYRLHYYPGNANLAPHMLLEEIGAPYELALVDRTQNAQKSPDYLKLNPHGRIPVLIDGDLVLYESAAICLHLADRHSAAGLAPPLGTPERAQLYKWLAYLTNTIQAELLVYFYPERWADDEVARQQVKAHAEARVGEMFDTIERELAAAGPYLLGARLSAADFFLLMVACWTGMMANPARNRPAVHRLLDRLAARPAVQRAFEAEGIAAP
jgi:glutathione S-transferase